MPPELQDAICSRPKSSTSQISRRIKSPVVRKSRTINRPDRIVISRRRAEESDSESDHEFPFEESDMVCILLEILCFEIDVFLIMNF